MKIALVSKAVYPTRGGVELHVHNLALELLALGHEVQVFISDGQASDAAPADYPVRARASFFSLYRAFAEERFEVVHAHGARLPVACSALLAGELLGLRTVFTPHCFYPAASWRGGLKRRVFDPTLGKLGMRKAQHIICLTDNDRRDAIDCGAAAGRIRMIPNAIRAVPLPGEAARESFRQRHHLGAFLLSVGRLHRIKRGDFLIAALAAIPPEIKLLFIGPDAGCLGQWQALAQRLQLETRVRFLPDIGDEELRLAYRASVALVMASAYEGLPTVLLEAMAMGTPVIAANSGGIGCLIEHGVNGLLYPYEDQAAFCRNVEQCLRKACPEMIDRARQRVLRQYLWPANAGRIAELYEHGGQ